MKRHTKSSLGRAFLLTLVIGFTATIGSAQLISEFEPNPPGADPGTMSFEISGTPATAFNGFVVSIECDSTSATGTVDRGEAVSGTFDANGLLTVTINDLENPSFTVALLSAWTGAIGDDIDTDDDGTADNFASMTVLDAIGVPDLSSDEAYLYGADLGGSDFVYPASPPTAEPENVFRDYSTGNLFAFYADTVTPPGKVYDATGTEVPIANFIYGDPTATSFGALNPSVLVPVELMTFTIE